MTDKIATFDELAALTTPTAETFTLPGGLKVRIRPITRAEHLLVGKGDPDALVIEQRIISAAMVEPKMNRAQVEAWQQSAAADVLSALSDRIRDLSGFGKGAAKSGVAEVGD